MNRIEPRSWRERLLAMNLILPILEIGVIGEALWLTGAIGRAVLRLRKMHWAQPAPEPPEPDEYDLLVTLVCLDEDVIGKELR